MSKDLTASQLLSNNLMGAPEVYTMSDEDEIKTYQPGFNGEDGLGETLVDLEEDLKDLGVMER